jgi:3-oxoacyl-[acyl-carrier-protein] synthase-3
VLTASERPGGILGFTLGADGSGSQLLIMPAGGSRLPLTQNVLDNKQQFCHMDGAGMYRFGMKALHKTVTEALKSAHMTMDDIELFIPHQSNARLIQQACAALHIPLEKAFINVDRYSNTSTAALPLAICDAVEAGRLRPGDHVLFATFGAGLTWAGAVLQWAVPAPIKPLPVWHRAWHAVRRGLAALRSRWLRLVRRSTLLEP